MLTPVFAFDITAQYVYRGVVEGMAYALVAVGLVLIYRASRHEEATAVAADACQRMLERVLAVAVEPWVHDALGGVRADHEHGVREVLGLVREQRRVAEHHGRLGRELLRAPARLQQADRGLLGVVQRQFEHRRHAEVLACHARQVEMAVM